MSGHELARRLRAPPQTVHAVLVALSGFRTPEDRARSREAGCERHFVKPVNPEKLIDFMRDIAAKLTH
jgi:CheY-like chemotaxis protein